MTAPRSELELAARPEGGPDRYRFRTADGLCSPDSFRTSELLLLDRLWDGDADRLLCPRANYGVVGTVAAHSGADVTMTETSARARNYCVRNAKHNDADATVELVADLATVDGRFDAVAYAPRAYTPLAVGKQRIADSLALLRPGGNLFVAGSREVGQTRYRACLAELCGDVETVTERDGVSLLGATRPAAFEAPTYVTTREIATTVDGVSLPLVSVPGLFSAGELDHGTRLLAETATLEDDQRVLDLCCGYGALGVYAAKSADCEIWLTDDDRVATCCAERTLEASGVSGRTVTADAVAGVADSQFDRILCNPPTHAGSAVLDDLFRGANGVLARGGELWVVHHRDLDLSDQLRPFSTVEPVRMGADHVVLRATN